MRGRPYLFLVVLQTLFHQPLVSSAFIKGTDGGNGTESLVFDADVCKDLNPGGIAVAAFRCIISRQSVQGPKLQ